MKTNTLKLSNDFLAKHLAKPLAKPLLALAKPTLAVSSLVVFNWYSHEPFAVAFGVLMQGLFVLLMATSHELSRGSVDLRLASIASVAFAMGNLALQSKFVAQEQAFHAGWAVLLSTVSMAAALYSAYQRSWDERAQIMS